MKKLILWAFALVMLAGVSASAQGKYGADSANCVNYLNFYKDYLKQGNYKDAAPLWSKAFRTCPPTASQNMILDGQKIMRNRLATVQGDERVLALDTLLMLADIREHNFPRYAKKAREGRMHDKINFSFDKMAVIEDIKAYVAENGQATDNFIIVSSLKMAINLYEQKKVNDEYVLNLYSEFSPIMAAKAEADEKFKKDQVAFDQMFAASGVASCENIEHVFGSKVDAEPDNKDLIQMVGSLMLKGECYDNPLFLKVYGKMHQMNPSYKSATALYRLYNKQDNYETALTYLNEAIGSADIPVKEKGALLFELASYNYQKLGNSAKAIAAAKEAVECDPDLTGKANFLMGTIWLNVKCSGNEMQQRAKYWVATDYFQKAKADPELADEAASYIARASVYFPKVEDAFMYDLSNGSSFSISCGGMSAVTTVRTTK